MLALDIGGFNHGRILNTDDNASQFQLSFLLQKLDIPIITKRLSMH